MSSTLEQDVSAVYDAYSTALLHYATRVIHDRDQARDAVQEVFLRYLTERRYGREIHEPRAWLFQSVRNYFTNVMKSAAMRRVDSLHPDCMMDRQTPEQILARKQLEAGIASLLTRRESQCL